MSFTSPWIPTILALILATGCGSDDSDTSFGGSGGAAGGASGAGGSAGASGGTAGGGAGGTSGAATGGSSGASVGGSGGTGTGGSAAGGSGGTCTSGTGGSGGCGNDGTNWPASSQKLECELIDLLNQKRATGVKCGTTDMGSAPALSRSQVLTQNARDHSEDMHLNGYIDLVEKDGTMPGDWAMKGGYCGKFVAAEIGAGHSSASTFLATLLNVETECVKLMQPGAKGIGVGYYTDVTGQSVHLWTLIIGNAP